MFTQCEEARTVLLKRWLPEVKICTFSSFIDMYYYKVAMVFVKQRRAWASLVPRSVIFTKPLMITRSISQEKRRIAETSGEILSVCKGGDVDAS